MEHLKHFLESGAIPFLMTTGVSPKFSFTRIVEAVIIALIAGALSYVLIITALQKDIEYTQKAVEEIKEDQRTWYNETRSEMSTLRMYAYTHNHSGE